MKYLFGLVFLATILLDIFYGTKHTHGICKYLSFLEPCILMLFYYFSSRRENYFYMVSFIFTLLGLYFYNYTTLSDNPVGIYFYGLGIVVYLLTIYERSDYEFLRKCFTKILPLLAILTIPVYLILRKVEVFLIVPVIFYSLILLLLIVVSAIKFSQSETETSKYLLFSSILLTISALVGSYLFYWEYNFTFRAFAILTFNFGHLFMCFYVLDSQKTNEPYLV